MFPSGPAIWLIPIGFGGHCLPVGWTKVAVSQNWVRRRVFCTTLSTFWPALFKPVPVCAPNILPFAPFLLFHITFWEFGGVVFQHRDACCTTCFLPRNEQKDQLQLKLENEADSPETLSPASIPWSKHAGLAGVVLLVVRSPHSESCDTEHCNSSVFFGGGRRIAKQTCHRCPSAGFGPFFGAAAFFWPMFCLGLYVEDLWRLGWMEASSTPQSKSRWVKKPRF